MRVSVIVPVYNTEKYLERCVSSLLEQTHKDLQIILINDGSDDHSLELMYKLAGEDKRICVIDKEHSGLSATRNAGMRIVDGDYVSFIDSDDWIAPEMYEVMLRQIEENSADAAYCEWTEEYSDGTSDIKSYDGKRNVVLTGDEIIQAYYKTNNIHLRISSGLISRKMIGELLFDTNLQPGEETYFSFRTLCNAKCVVYSNHPFYHRYNRLGSISNQNAFRRTDLRRAISTDMMLDYVKNNFPQHLSLSYNHCFKYYETVLNYLLYFRAEKAEEDIYHQINNRLKELYYEMDNPRKTLEIPVYVAFWTYRLCKPIYTWIVRIYYKNIKKEFDSKRQK